jgi:hypothetical protein
MSEVNTPEVFEDADIDATAEIRESFDAAIADEASEDDIKMSMIGAGATFKNVTRLYNQFMIESGLAISKSDRNELVEDTLTGKSFAEEEDFNSAVDELMEVVKGCTERSAAALVRAYAKKNELDVYAKPKGQGGNRVGFAGKFYEFLLQPRTEVEAKAYVMGTDGHVETSPNTQNHLSHYMGIWKLTSQIHAA